MHNIIQNLIYIEEEVKSKIKDLNIIRIPKIIAVSKTFTIDRILPLINYGHIDYGENKVLETIEKWTEVKAKNKNVKLHLIGKLQTNKLKLAIKIFDYIHSVDSEKLATKIATEQKKINKKIKIFIQINIGEEEQKLGIKKEQVFSFHKFCQMLNLDVVGTMCIPPKEGNTQNFFLEMNKINKELNLTRLSMGMSEDYLLAVQNNATHLRIGSKIFGHRD